jgi:hypothetical protein
MAELFLQPLVGFVIFSCNGYLIKLLNVYIFLNLYHYHYRSNNKNRYFITILVLPLLCYFNPASAREFCF